MKTTLFIFLFLLMLHSGNGQIIIYSDSLLVNEQNGTTLCYNNTGLMAGNTIGDRYLVYFNTDTIFLNVKQSGTWMRKTAHTGSNIKSATLVPDPWLEKEYPLGLFRTSCIIPRFLLNTGQHNISLYINRRAARDLIFYMNNVISFNVVESQERIKDCPGVWIGAVRPLLHWETTQLE